MTPPDRRRPSPAQLRPLDRLPSAWVRALPLAGGLLGVVVVCILPSLISGTSVHVALDPLTFHRAWLGGMVGSVLGHLAAPCLASRPPR